MEMVKTSKKAVLYARVSSDMQKKEKTVDSQISELKRQIIKAGDVLIKEYVDDGFSGAVLDRPAMDQLRTDLKTDLFETIYFLNTDRIARDVAYQTIIVAEILKYQKQLIINGKDYVQNSENKFTLTILGAVSELERAKISERMSRGRAYKLAHGHHVGSGSKTYGYDYIYKTPDTRSGFKINEHEATAVRYVFEEYAKGGVSAQDLAHRLKEMGYITKRGSERWDSSSVISILENHAYTGTMYMNREKVVKENITENGKQKTVRKILYRDKSEWVGISMPPIISKELYEKVQGRIAWNKENYRTKDRSRLLSNLILCGTCGAKYHVSNKTYPWRLSNGQVTMYTNTSYVCNRYNHYARFKKDGAHIKQISAKVIEEKILEIMSTKLIDPKVIMASIPAFKGSKENMKLRLKRRLLKLEKNIRDSKLKKKKILELYTSNDIDREDYSKSTSRINKEIEKFESEQAELKKQSITLYDKEVIYKDIVTYCTNLKERLPTSTDYKEQRKLFLGTITKVIFNRDDTFTLHGSIGAYQIEYVISDKVVRADRNKQLIGK